MERVRSVAVCIFTSVLKVPGSLNLRAQYRVRFQNRLPRKIFGTIREKITGDWRKLHNEKLLCIHSSPDID
jgi:hypothetical protein